MTNNDLPAVSAELARLLRLFAKHAGRGVRMNPSALDTVIAHLKWLHQLSVSMEQELEIHRLIERNKAACAEIEKLATDVITSDIVEQNGKVIRPKFGRKP